jgi:phosphotransferase system enzyme I (PtsI)
VDAALGFGAEGIGLYRSEFLVAGGPPEVVGEEEQYAEYRRVVERMAPRPVTIRTFDIDEREHESHFSDPGNPAPWASGTSRLTHGGLRGVRFALAHPDILRTQLRALLRAAAHGPLRILVPFVTSAREMRAVRAVLADARAALASGTVAQGEASLGAMIEVPAAALTASLLAEDVDFFTIGSNDLIQYALAVDRTDDRVAACYEPLHPAVLRLLRLVVRAGRRKAVPVALCGEMAADPVLLPLLIGCGLREFSMTPGALAAARQAVSETSAGEMARVAARALTLATVEEIQKLLLDALDWPRLHTAVHHE